MKTIAAGNNRSTIKISPSASKNPQEIEVALKELNDALGPLFAHLERKDSHSGEYQKNPAGFYTVVVTDKEKVKEITKTILRRGFEIMFR